MSTSSLTGQKALRPLPSKERIMSNPNAVQRSLTNYPTNDKLTVNQRKSMNASSQLGIDVFKVTRTGKLQVRRVALSPNNRSIFVTSNRIKSFKHILKMATGAGSGALQVTAKGIDVSTIDRIHRGQQTKRFLLARSEVPTMVNDNANCLSIVYRATTTSAGALGDGPLSAQKARGPHHFDSLDLVIQSKDDYTILVTALEDLVKLWKEERKRYDRDVLMLQHYWIDLGKETPMEAHGDDHNHHTTLSKDEWIMMCDKLNLPVKKVNLGQFYKDYMMDIGKDVGEGLTLAETAELFSDMKAVSLKAVGMEEDTDDPLCKLWNEILRIDPVPFIQTKAPSQDEADGNGHDAAGEESSISAVAFLSFIRAQQKEFKTSLEDVLSKFQLLNHQITLEDVDTMTPSDTSGTNHERISRSRFIDYLTGDTNDILDPFKGQLTQDMTEPLSHYWIQTCHDTFLSKTLLSKPQEEHFETDLQMYQMALFRGVRCLELDVWDSSVTGSEPVVARRPSVMKRHTPTTTGGPSSPTAGGGAVSSGGSVASHQDTIGGGPLETSFKDGVPLSFINVLEIVKNYVIAHPQTFPIILYIENHCSPKVQEKMAIYISRILAKHNLLYIPPSGHLSIDLEDSEPLPSPAELKGKVLIKGKLPKMAKQGATVHNDDYDDENHEIYMIGMGDDNDEGDGDDDENKTMDDTESDDFVDEDRKVIGFDQNGPIYSSDADAVTPLPAELYAKSLKEASESRVKALKLEKRAQYLEKEAAEAKQTSDSLMAEAGLGAERIGRDGTIMSTGVEVELTEAMLSSNSTGDSQPNSPQSGVNDSEGLEIHEFFDQSVEHSGWEYSVAHAAAMSAAQETSAAKKVWEEDCELVKAAEEELEESHRKAADASETARKAAVEARSNREHADQARLRVDQVQNILNDRKSKTNSAETVVATAEAEAKISEQRAQQIEARATRAQARADDERARAEVETKEEEKLEKIANQLHDELTTATNEANDSRDRLQKAKTMLDRVNEQIKLIETSTQYQKERAEYDEKVKMSDGSRSVRISRFLAKHNAKIEERRVCAQMIEDANEEAREAEKRRRAAAAAFDDQARRLKKQTDAAHIARKKADRATAAAEEIAEHAEEEREAAMLRSRAKERARDTVVQQEANFLSVEEQLVEAERASIEAASLAVESRKKAERLAEMATAAKDHTRERFKLDEAKAKAEKTHDLYLEALEKQQQADENAKNAKRLMKTSSEVLLNAQRDNAAEIQRMNEEKEAEIHAANAYNAALEAAQQAEEARAQAKEARRIANEKAEAEKYAEVYNTKMDRVVEISQALAEYTTLHSTKFRSWEKSMSLPPQYMHNMPQGSVLEQNGEFRDNCIVFTNDHMIRTFPDGHELENYDPVLQWSMGVQMVSMNHMNHYVGDDHLLLNDGRFRQNASCGYVLKADNLIDDTIPPEKSQQWKIQILSGYGLPEPESRAGRKYSASMHHISPRVRVTLFDGAEVSDSEGSVRMRDTKAAPRNGFNPVWNENEFGFRVEKPSVAMILFTVYDCAENGTEDFIAAAAIPVSCMREGYRSVALFDSMNTRSGPYAFASLFVKAQKI